MSEEIFKKNLEAFRYYAQLRGGRYNEHGWLLFENVILTQSDEEYLAKNTKALERPLTLNEIEAAWNNLVSLARGGE